MACSAPCPELDLCDLSLLGNGADQWEALLERSYDNRLFYTAAWLRLWWQHFGGGNVVIPTIRADDGSLDAALPLLTEIRAGRRVVTLLGDFNVSDYMDGLADRPRASSLLESLLRSALTCLPWDEVEFRHVPTASPLLGALQSTAATYGWSCRIQGDGVCPVAILCSTWEGYLQMLSKKQRHEIRRKLRRATENCTWEWRTTTTAEDLERDLPVFFRLHELSEGEKAGFLTEVMRRYFAAMAAEQLAAGQLRLSVLERNGEDIAATLSFVYRDRYLLYNSGYNPAHAALSPGIVAVAMAMQDAIAEKASAFDFLTGDEPYKYQFGATNTYTCRASLVRAS